MVKEEDFYTREKEIFAFLDQKMTQKKLLQMNWSLDRLSNSSPEYIRKNFLLLNILPKLELKER
jgi:hypothetical protein